MEKYGIETHRELHTAAKYNQFEVLKYLENTKKNIRFDARFYHQLTSSKRIKKYLEEKYPEKLKSYL